MSQSATFWGSRFGFIMAATGAAVGLGNIWKFPYMAGQNGGGLFVLLYLVFLFAIGVPTMIAEVALGKLGRKNILDSLQDITRRYNLMFPWVLVGLGGVFALLLVLGFYSAIAGWSLAYFVKTLSGQVTNQSPEAIGQMWSSFLADPIALMSWHTLYLGMTLGIVVTGVNRGIEGVSNWAVPMLFAVLLFLVGYAYVYGDWHTAYHFLFEFRYDAITPQVVIAAMGQALFSLAVGAGAMLVYGAYVPDKMALGSNLTIVATLNAIVAILAGLAIFPLVFSYGLSPADGPDLMFKVLPLTFNDMAYGQLVGALFFFLLFMAALTSSFSQAEPLVMLLVEKCGVSRMVSAIMVGIVSWTIGVAALLSFNVWSEVHVLGDRNLFETFAEIATDYILPIGAFGFAYMMAWLIPKKDVQAAVRMPDFAFTLWRFSIRVIVPITLFWIFISGLLD